MLDVSSNIQLEAALPKVKSPHAAIEILGAGVTRQWLYDYRIVTYTILDVTRELVDTWIEGAKQGSRVWKPDQTICILYDFGSARHLSRTPYLTSRLGELTKLRSGSPTFSAIILADTFFGKLVAQTTHFYFQSVTRVATKIEVFYNRQSGLNWLIKQGAIRHISD